jgi:hypothetical protein
MLPQDREGSSPKAIDELFDKVWDNRHQIFREKIEEGQIKFADDEPLTVEDHLRRPIKREVWKMEVEAAAKLEQKYGRKNLGPWDDFEWGMLNGKLSALRWALGEDWDMLDT